MVTHLAGAQPSDQETKQQKQEVVVTGTRVERPLANSPVATEIISAKQIEESGAENLGELLEEHRGIEVFRSFRGQSVRIEGLDPEYVLVLVDGERVLGRTGGAVDLSRMPLDGVHRVEIVKGPSSALYGSDAIGGVINVITKRGSRPFESLARASYGSRNEKEAV